MTRSMKLFVLGFTMFVGAFIYMKANDDVIVYKGIEYKRVYDSELVGWYQLRYNLEDGTPVFEITTPRGVEKVVGEDNLQSSLDSYRDDRIYGLPIWEARISLQADGLANIYRIK